jgi:hypothetical protein
VSLLDEGWTEVQAIGVLDMLKLKGGIPNWKPEHLQKLHDWCSAHENSSARRAGAG